MAILVVDIRLRIKSPVFMKGTARMVLGKSSCRLQFWERNFGIELKDYCIEENYCSYMLSRWNHQDFIQKNGHDVWEVFVELCLKDMITNLHFPNKKMRFSKAFLNPSPKLVTACEDIHDWCAWF